MSTRGPTRRRAIELFGALAVSGIARPLLAEPARATWVVPLAKVPELEVATVVRALGAFYAGPIEVGERRALPRAAFYPPRARYRAERLLEDLAAHAPESAFRVLGLTNVDISTTKGDVEDWGILGLATIDGRVGVLSSFRCRRGAKNAEHVAHRLGKTAVHELGHTFGLEHCPNQGCLMEDGKGTVTTTDRECDLCASCRGELRGKKLLIEPRREPPWQCS